MITSTSNPLIKELTKLHLKKYRDASQQFLVEGEHLVSEAIVSNRLIQLFVTPNYHGQVTFDNVQLISTEIGQKLTQTESSSSIFGLCKMAEECDLNGTHFLLCDQIQDPGNLGTIIRTAHSFGFDGVVVSKDSVDFYNDKVVRSSQGALFHIDCVRAELKDVIFSLKKRGIVIVGTDVHNANYLKNVKCDKVAIVVGNEGQGVSEAILNIVDYKVKIETSEFESLNVGVATGILLYHFRKQ